jgi:hypothetical protein
MENLVMYILLKDLVNQLNEFMDEAEEEQERIMAEIHQLDEDKSISREEWFDQTKILYDKYFELSDNIIDASKIAQLLNYLAKLYLLQ